MRTINKQGRHNGGERIAAMTVRQTLRNMGVKEFPGNVGGWCNRSSLLPFVDSYAISLLGRFEASARVELQSSNDANVEPSVSRFGDYVPLLEIDHPQAISYVSSCQPDRRLIYVSQQISQLGYAPEDLLNQPDLRLKQVHEDDFAQFEKAFRNSCKAAGKFSCHYRLYDNTGKVRWFHDEACVVCDDSGVPKFIKGVMLDITDKKRLEQEVVEHRYFLERNVEQRTAQLMKRIAMLESCNDSLCERLSAARLEIASLQQQLQPYLPDADENQSGN